MSGAGQRIIDGIKDAVAGNFAAVTIDGQRWVPEPPRWQPIETVPHDTTVILANFENQCLLTGAPHVWTATYVTEWCTFNGEPVDAAPRWNECSFAAMNENGEPTHWMPLPAPPSTKA